MCRPPSAHNTSHAVRFLTQCHVTCARRAGSELLLNDERPNGELLLATGRVQELNAADHLQWPAALVPADRYFMMKNQILESFGFNANESFPVFADRMPIQLLAYLRLTRVADPALFAKVRSAAPALSSWPLPKLAACGRLWAQLLAVEYRLGRGG
jgi:hypothetical protein